VFTCMGPSLKSSDGVLLSSVVMLQTALILSIPRRRPVDETQETLRTSAFPSTHIKEKWAKNLYIGGITYGRTVS
jgi:hypothetical protein